MKNGAGTRAKTSYSYNSSQTYAQIISDTFHIFHHKRKSENDNTWFTQTFVFFIFMFCFFFGRLNLLGALSSIFGRQRLMGCILSKTGHARNSKNSLVTYVHQVLPIGVDFMSPNYWRSTLTNVGTKGTRSTQMTECIWKTARVIP